MGKAVRTTGDRRATSDSRIRLSRHGVDDDVELQEYPVHRIAEGGGTRGVYVTAFDCPTGRRGTVALATTCLGFLDDQPSRPRSSRSGEAETPSAFWSIRPSPALSIRAGAGRAFARCCRFGFENRKYAVACHHPEAPHPG